MTATAPIRDRITELRRVKASELLANPRNWRKHPSGQAAALSAVLREVGYADALLARETPRGLELIDGHLRQKLTPDQEVPVLVLDVTEEEANKILLTLDPLAALAESDKQALDTLLRDVSTGDAALQEMIERLGIQAGVISPDDPIEHWRGMPEFEQENQLAKFSVQINFADEESVRAFGSLIGQGITTKTKSVWYPEQPRVSTLDREFISESTVPSLHS